MEYDALNIPEPAIPILRRAGKYDILKTNYGCPPGGQKTEVLP
jgi:hypothetical protein